MVRIPRVPRGPRLRIVVGAAIAVVIVAAVLSVVVDNGQSDSCRAVGDLFEFNDSQTELLRSRTHIPAAGSYDEPSAPTADDYAEWAQGLKKHAAGVTDPELAKHARRVAELANQTVGVVEQFRGESSTRDLLDRDLPSSVEKYSEVTANFKDEMQALEEACPRAS